MKELNQIPGWNEPDPDNLRQRPFQGGTDGLPDGGPTMDPNHGQLKATDSMDAGPRGQPEGGPAGPKG